MSKPIGDHLVVAGVNPVGGHVEELPSHQAINEKMSLNIDRDEEKRAADPEKDGGDHGIKAVSDDDDDSRHDKDEEVPEGQIIITGLDAATYLLPLRDDFQPALTFRSLFLASGLCCFQAVMSQIYSVRGLPTFNFQCVEY